MQQASKEYWIHLTDEQGNIQMERISRQRLKREFLQSLTAEELTELMIERADNEKRNEQLKKAVKFMEDDIWKSL